LNCFLAGTEIGEGRAKVQRATALAGAELLVEKLDERVELVMDERLVEGGERDGLGETGTGFDEDEFGAEG